MPKRFTDTNIWNKAWYMDLPPTMKCLARYLFDNCDAAGVWTPNWKLASAHIGDAVTAEHLSQIADQVEILEDGKIFLPDFIPFQYGTLSEFSPAHKPVFQSILKNNLTDRVFGRVSKTLQEKDKDKDKEKEEDKPEEGSGEKPIRKPSLKKAAEQERQIQLRAGYKTLQQEMEGKPDKDAFALVKKFVEEEKPDFAEPFVDAWNIFAPWYGLEQVREITPDRRDKIHNRSREPSFDLFKILSVIRQHKWYTGDNRNGWKITFNYIIDSQRKYTEIIEKYKD